MTETVPTGSCLHSMLLRNRTTLICHCADERCLSCSRRTIEKDRGAQLSTPHEQGRGKQCGEDAALVQSPLRIVLAHDILPGIAHHVAPPSRGYSRHFHRGALSLIQTLHSHNSCIDAPCFAGIRFEIDSDSALICALNEED